MPDVDLGYQDPTLATTRLRAKQLGTVGGVPVVAEYLVPHPGDALAAGSVAVGVSAAPLILAATPCLAVLLVADLRNAVAVWIGDAAVAVESGFPLVPGSAPQPILIDDVSKVYAVAEATGAKLHWLRTA